MAGGLFSADLAGPGFRRFFVPGAQVASLFVTGWAVWTVVLSLEPLPNAIPWILGLSLLAWSWCAGMFALLHLLSAEPILARNRRTLLRTSTAAVWFAPTAILVAERSQAAMVAGLILVVTATRVLGSEWRLANPEPQTQPAPGADRLFEDWAQGTPGIARRLAPKWALAFVVQVGVVAILMGDVPLAAGCLAVSAAIFTAVGTAGGVLPQGQPRGLPACAIAALLTLLLAVALTVGSLTREPERKTHQLQELSFQPDRGLVSRDSPRPRTVPGGSNAQRPMEADAAPNDPTGDTGGVGDDEFPGVILWPEVKPVTTLVALMPSRFSLSARPARPLSIPFAGEYWMFRAPSLRPPHGSFFQRGNPAALSFSTTDHAPLEMEAHDRLEQSIDLRCCRKIQAAIWNADHYPGTVALELLLIDREQRSRPPQSLGASPVKSSPRSLPVREILDFPVPTPPRFRRFDEFEILFHRDRSRIDKSARIQIERFVLVPVNPR